MDVKEINAQLTRHYESAAAWQAAADFIQEADEPSNHIAVEKGVNATRVSSLTLEEIKDFMLQKKAEHTQAIEQLERIQVSPVQLAEDPPPAQDQPAEEQTEGEEPAEGDVEGDDTEEDGDEDGDEEEIDGNAASDG